MVTRPRHGMTLVELLAAMPLLACIALVGSMLVLDAQRTTRRLDGRNTRTREMRHAALAIASSLRALHSNELIAFNDTLLEFESTTGMGIVCGVPDLNRIDILPATGRDPLRATWSAAPDIGDNAHIALTPNAPGNPASLHHATISAIGTSSTGCSTSPLRAAVQGNVIRITLTPPPASPAQLGTPVRFSRRTRLSLYRASDNDWYLGLRTRSGTTWDIIQPVAGPFASATMRGLRFQVRSRTGALLAAQSSPGNSTAPAAATPASVTLLLRAIAPYRRTDGTSDADSIVTTIALRNR